MTLTPAMVAEQGGKFVYFLKRYLHSEEMTKIAGTSWEIPTTVGMEAGPAFEMPDGREIIIHWRNNYATGEFTDGHVSEYASGRDSADDGWMLD